jgi:Tfp pilus assembly protein PilX
MKMAYSRQNGGALIMVLVITTLVGSVLMAYLSMLKSQNLYSSRSLAWTTAMPMAEAGIEEALAHINYSGTTNLASDGWVKTSNYYFFERPLTNGYARITVSTDAAPIIVSRGFVQAPLQSSYIGRTVQVGTRKRSPFQAGLTAKSTITAGGAGIDSFDSTDPLHSTLGLYDVAKREANGTVQSVSGSSGVITVSTRIYGKVATGPGGSVTINNGSVGDIAWNSDPANSGKIEPGYSSTDVNLSLEDVAIPFTNGFSALASGTNSYKGTNYNYRLNSGNYQVGTFQMNASETMVVASNATLYVTGDFTINGQASIYVAPGGNLKLYLGGNDNKLNGGGISNGSGVATNLSIYGLNTASSIKYAGNAQFIGTVYAPQSDVVMTGTSDVFGAIVGKTITTGGSMTFHYDESLGGGNSKYIVVSWTEL